MSTELDPAYAKAAALIREAGVEPADPLNTPVEAARAAQDRYFRVRPRAFLRQLRIPGPATREYSKWVWRQYLGTDLERADPAAVPLEADVAGFPPTWLGVGDADPLLDDTLRFAEKLRAAGVAVEVKCYPGLPHAFVMLTRLFDGAANAVRDAAAAARRFVA